MPQELNPFQYKSRAFNTIARMYTLYRRRSAYTVISSPDVFKRPSVLTHRSNDSGFVSMLQTDAWRTVQEVNLMTCLSKSITPDCFSISATATLCTTCKLSEQIPFQSS